MSATSAIPIARNTRTILGFTAVGAFTAYGKTVTQTQYIAEKYVVTEVERGIFIFLGSRKERFLVDLAAGGLRRLEPPARRIGRETLQSVIGEIAIRRDDAPVEVEGFLCERYHFSSADARIVIEGETLAARIPGLERTALQGERDLDALLQPFSLPLEPDQLVVRSLLRTSAASDFNQTQTYRLVTISSGIDEAERLERMARLPTLC